MYLLIYHLGQVLLKILPVPVSPDSGMTYPADEPVKFPRC